MDSKGKPFGSAVLVPTDKPSKSEPVLSPNAGMALKALEAALSESDDQPVSKEQWREKFDKLHPSDKADTKAKAFGRSLKAIVDEGLVLEKAELYSLR